jgi:hypothetical protein
LPCRPHRVHFPCAQHLHFKGKDNHLEDHRCKLAISLHQDLRELLDEGESTLRANSLLYHTPYLHHQHLPLFQAPDFLPVRHKVPRAYHLCEWKVQLYPRDQTRTNPPQQQEVLSRLSTPIREARTKEAGLGRPATNRDAKDGNTAHRTTHFIYLYL